MAKKSRISKKQKYEFKTNQALLEPAALGAQFICNKLNMAHAYNWYNENKEVKALRKFVEQYATKKMTKKIAALISDKNVKDSEFSMTMCATAKMFLANCKLEKQYIDFLERRIKEICARYDLVDVPEVTEVKFNNHENKAICDTEDMLDVFYKSEYKAAPVEFFEYLQKQAVKPADVRSLIFYYEPLLTELENEETNLTKKQKANYIAFVKKILDDSLAYLTNTRKVNKLRKPRKKKIKSADQLVSRVQFKQSEPKLKITSIPPSTIIGANNLWFYNAKYKRLTYLTADEGNTLSIKGTTVTGFNDKKSVTKTIRKPEITLSELLNSGKVTMLKNFLALKTKAIVAKGRLNADTVLLKASK